ncbi:probable endochitinase [Malaya genurostris]|uniref:probable endochitinase n=1 Tax=Malaya genurostris TaxID=325434 RepID=UPI0026F3FF4D|nr:probable endochitinase [Malaya genurostris]
MKISYWINLGIAVLLQAVPSKCEENTCGVQIGSGVTATKCKDCYSLIVCIADDYSFEVTCNQDEYCTEIAGLTGKAICNEFLPPQCNTSPTTTATVPTTGSSTNDPEATTVSTTMPSTNGPGTTTVDATTTTTQPTNDEPTQLCTGTGTYPDPKNCSIYHYCPGLNEESWVQRCPPDYAFNHESITTGQFPCKANRACDVVDCSGSTKFKSFGTSKVLYAVCQPDGETITMYRCSDGATFNGTDCVFNCKQEGLFPNTADPSKYYRCYISGTKLVSLENDCPANKVFNTAKQVCTKTGV